MVDAGDNTFKEGAEHQKARQAASLLYSMMSMDVLEVLDAKATAKDAWDLIANQPISKLSQATIRIWS